MYEQVYSDPDIFKIDVPLPENPLRNLNCYVVKTPEQNLIIDTGFNRAECLEALQTGLQELEIDMSKTAIFLTHLHADHVGLTSAISTPETTIYMGGKDYRHLTTFIQSQLWEEKEEKYMREGMSSEELRQLQYLNPVRIYLPDTPFKAVEMKDGDLITVGDYTFTCVETPGHTPGHTCLYLPEKKLLFLGDHVLFDITPNISFWANTKNSLLKYIQSLEKISKLEVETALPAHRTVHSDFQARISELIEHHRVRLDECLRIVRENPNLTAYEIAGQMQWQIRARNWESFPVTQKWFAVGEAIAHLDYLRAEDKVEKFTQDGLIRYYAL